ncbi:hypothetical protein M436DRAFT_72480 [Aureobasidium namibiae CBS 147.97]|uniref:Uncharacterized protein n=1 Tax=Aureobasidium namibiae CBS 147.97 TaxID=1043004 RepID=A0A074XHU4_9PEZI|nr:uncharacterized protein M436DRAFT_72480 [Aureobasidium namibiae CBS 147.97]KEQ74116.1 hypothetical protein M436DRAFT_72480 [Aureobasidium namibiae CBS 147.97]
MRMTRAQAAALAAAEDQAVDQPNDHLDDSNENEKGASTTPTDGPSEREALAELTTNRLDTNKHQDADAVSGEQVDEPEEQVKEEEHKEEEHTNGDAESGAQIGDQESTSAPTVPITNGKPIHQDAAVQKDVGSPTTELPLLNITPQRTPAKNMIKNEFAHMRSTSNKENMVPGSPAVAAPLASSQTTLAPEQSEIQTQQHTQHDEQPQPSTPEQNIESHNHKDTAETTTTELESTQTDDTQDDSLIGHFEALSVSPKKQKFAEQEVMSGAERSAPEQSASESEKQTQDAPESAPSNSVAPQDKEKKPSASPSVKKPASSRIDDTKPARKPSVRQSTLDRQSSVVRKSMAPPSRPEPSASTAIKRTTSVKRSSVRPSMAPRAGSSQSAERGAPANIPHSKPRPISMSFPTPPPPPKSTKAATTSTFQLPGEAIAAKLKADKEARLQRQAEAGSSAKSTYKPPTTQRSTKAPTRATFQLPEKEERQKRQEENGAAASKSTYVPPVTQKSTKPVTKATFQLSSDAFAAKMKAQKEARLAKQKEEEEQKEKERGVFKARPVPKMGKPAEVRQNAASRARLPSGSETSAAIKRSSSVRDPNTASKRLSSFHPSASSSTTLPPRAATSFQKRQSMAPSASKGKEVFGRAKEEKEKEDRGKKEKEEAAKKARAEAAEQGRQRSREWADKKKAKEKEERRKTVAAGV